MSLKESNASNTGSSESEYDEVKTTLLYHNLRDNFQQVGSQLKKYSEIIQDLSKDMDDINKSMATLQEHSLAAKNQAAIGETTTQQKEMATILPVSQ
ncbi:hypothetical protein L798_00504 [Zootermopsis nevadensis]|uniref:Uncharacterized protein n=1 Tax=Zootermopsis nevadensis TaxID=136037 RepID=A0A067QKE3_ZOONE|nr:hypothetical protein L798_00504 [Zootermopsis nevadensis]